MLTSSPAGGGPHGWAESLGPGPASPRPTGPPTAPTGPPTPPDPPATLAPPTTPDPPDPPGSACPAGRTRSGTAASVLASEVRLRNISHILPDTGKRVMPFHRGFAERIAVTAGTTSGSCRRSAGGR